MTSSTKGRRSKRIQLAEELESYTANELIHPLLKGVIYARYSNGGSQTDQSLEGQVRECRRYAAEHNIQIVEEYLDPHISGKDAEHRPAFQQMISDSDKRTFDVVIVWKTDRFARNRYDSARYKEYLKRNGVTLRYAAENIPNTSEGIILESMLEGMAEYYSADLRQKILRGMKESAYKCKALTRPPIGYKLDAEKHYIIDEQIAPYIQQIFQMYIAGEKLSAISNKMNAIGLKTTKKNPFNINAIRQIVENEKYIGVYEYKAGGIRKENAFPAIIEKDVFLSAQERRVAQKKGTYCKRNYGGSAKHTYLLSGMVYCGECGSTMFGETTTKCPTDGVKAEYSYYSCRQRRQKGKDRCDNKAVPKELLEDIVKKAIKNVISTPSVLDTLCKVVIQADINQNVAIRLKALKQRKSEKESAVRNILEALENGFYSESVLKHLKTLENEVQNLELEIQKCNTSNIDIYRRINWLLDTYPMLDNADDEYWKEIIHCFIKSVTCFKNGTVVIRFNLHHAPSYDGPVLGLEVTDLLEHYISDSYNSEEEAFCAEDCYPHQTDIIRTFFLLEKGSDLSFILPISELFE
jgi:DNA invertase Pin-like site-specific DNA recombinase